VAADHTSAPTLIANWYGMSFEYMPELSGKIQLCRCRRDDRCDLCGPLFVSEAHQMAVARGIYGLFPGANGIADVTPESRMCQHHKLWHSEGGGIVVR
jgi:hypothetical protein